MTAPNVPIDVNPETGVWQSDGLPMLYVPRHFFNNLHLNIEQMVGRERYRDNLFQSGHKSAWFWCEASAQEHDLQPIACYEFYLQRLSQRGWGLFCFEEQQLSEGHALVRVDQSSFVLHKQHFALASPQGACYMFEGWCAGAADWVSEKMGWSFTYECREQTCASAIGGNSCLFQLAKKQ